MTRRRALALSLLVLTLAASIPVWAQSSSTTMLVSALVISVCTIATTPMVFGNYSPLASTATTAEADVTITCTQGAVTTVGLDNGLNFSSPNRRMRLLTSANYLPYQIYKEVSHTNIWGNSGAALLDTGTAPSILPRTFKAYGKIEPGQDVPTSLSVYADTITATVNF